MRNQELFIKYAELIENTVSRVMLEAIKKNMFNAPNFPGKTDLFARIREKK